MEGGGYNSMACFLYVSPPQFLRQGLSLDQELTIQSDCLVEGPDEPPVPPSLVLGCRCALPHLDFLWVLEPELILAR